MDSGNRKITGTLFAAAIIVAALTMVMIGRDWAAMDRSETGQVFSSIIEPAAGEVVKEEETVVEDVETKPVETAAVPGADPESKIPLRALGDPKAPVRIDEYASLSCSHCADFHKETFAQTKAELIDTGKVYFVYHDFPLNAPALDAALIARCLPEDRYFQFTGFLFEQQDNWATKEDYQHVLRQNAKLLGASDEMLDECLADEDMKQALTSAMKAASDRHKISSTPSFVINGLDVLSGAISFESLKEAVEKNMPQEKTVQ